MYDNIPAKKVFFNDDLRRLIFSFYSDFPYENKLDKCIINCKDKYNNCCFDCQYKCYSCLLNLYCLFYVSTCCNCNCMFFYNWLRNVRI